MGEVALSGKWEVLLERAGKTFGQQDIYYYKPSNYILWIVYGLKGKICTPLIFYLISLDNFLALTAHLSC